MIVQSVRNGRSIVGTISQVIVVKGVNPRAPQDERAVFRVMVPNALDRWSASASEDIPECPIVAGDQYLGWYSQVFVTGRHLGWISQLFVMGSFIWDDTYTSNYWWPGRGESLFFGSLFVVILQSVRDGTSIWGDFLNYSRVSIFQSARCDWRSVFRMIFSTPRCDLIPAHPKDCRLIASMP